MTEEIAIAEKKTAKIDIINRRCQNNTKNPFCFKYYFNTSRCEKRNELPHCKYAKGPLSLSMKILGVIPDLRDDAATIAYGDLCFLHCNHTMNATDIISRSTRGAGTFIVLSVIIGSLITIALAGTFHNQLRRFSDEANGRLEQLQKDFTKQLNTIEDQVRDINEEKLQLPQSLNRLAEITAHLASKQEDFQNLQLSADQQLLQQQISNPRMIIENRRLASSINAGDTQREIEEYYVRKLILNTLKGLKTIPDLRNDTVYSNRIHRVILINTDVCRTINQSQANVSN